MTISVNVVGVDPWVGVSVDVEVCACELSVSHEVTGDRFS